MCWWQDRPQDSCRIKWDSMAPVETRRQKGLAGITRRKCHIMSALIEGGRMIAVETLKPCEEDETVDPASNPHLPRMQLLRRHAKDRGLDSSTSPTLYTCQARRYHRSGSLEQSSQELTILLPELLYPRRPAIQKLHDRPWPWACRS